VVFLAAILGIPCAAAAPPPKPLRVVATTGMIGDAARAVGGDRVEVTTLMGEGVDPHLYKPSPGDMRTLAGAELILYNGLHLEGRLGETLAKLEKRTRIVPLAEAIDRARLLTPAEFEGHPDPHVWFDPLLWSAVIERLRDVLIELDPAGAESYRSRAAAQLQELKALDGWIRTELAAIPRERRVLVTAHDAFAYFGRAYDLEVLAVQGISTDSEASLRDINALVETLSTRRIPAVFWESSVPRRTVEALVEGCQARGHKVTIGGELFSDAVGKSGTPEATLAGMLRHNTRMIVAALRGPVALPAAPAPQEGQGAAPSTR
jgi:manganese/zinc/iron transport system substrate-binding protein